MTKKVELERKISQLEARISEKLDAEIDGGGKGRRF